jgi:hypothetical protein
MVYTPWVYTMVYNYGIHHASNATLAQHSFTGLLVPSLPVSRGAAPQSLRRDSGFVTAAARERRGIPRPAARESLISALSAFRLVSLEPTLCSNRCDLPQVVDLPPNRRIAVAMPDSGGRRYSESAYAPSGPGAFPDWEISFREIGM